MDKNAIKKYAVWARRELISRVSTKALQYGITEKDWGNPGDDSVNGTLLTAAQKKQRQALIAQIKEKGCQEVMEEVAYTWFNRFSALRFMEVNGYLPTHVRVFTDEDNAFKPQIITEAIHLEIDGLDMEKVYAYKDADEKDELYKYLLITQCNALSPILPGMFQRLSDYTELLFPDNLLREGSAIEQMITLIPEEDWKDAVQIIGWLYQYYNAEKKDDVFAALKKNVKITKENIPAATQLFTPDWIVRYMVENSLGRLWLEGHPNAELQGDWKYYLEEAEQEPEVQTQLATIRKEYESMKPEDIKCIDPCCGSGHILAYLFDVLVQIYEAYGYTTREAVVSIVENNIYGLDIDDRAAQLANFAVMMKARQYDHRFFAKKDDDGKLAIPQPRVYAICESNDISKEYLDCFANGDAKLSKEIHTLADEMHDAKEYGSILNISVFDFNAIMARFDEIENEAILSLYTLETMNQLLPVVRVAQVLAQKYYAVVTNPPYAAAKGLNPHLREYLVSNYAIGKYDLFGAFIIKCMRNTKDLGFTALITPVSPMYNPSFETLRNELIRKCEIVSLIELGSDAFEVGFGTSTYVLSPNKMNGYIGKYFDVSENIAKDEFVNTHEYHSSTAYFSEFDEKKIMYKLNKDYRRMLTKASLLSNIGNPRIGMQTNDNNRFLRLWHEIDKNKFEPNHCKGSAFGDAKWFPIVKGGGFRKWFGNIETVVNWQYDGAEIRELNKNAAGGRIVAEEFYFCDGLTWTHTTYTQPFSIRYMPEGTMINVEGPAIFSLGLSQKYVLGCLNSVVAKDIFEKVVSSIHFSASELGNFPLIYQPDNQVDILVENNITIAQTDWNSFEISWDFAYNPLIRCASVAEAYAVWENECADRFNKLKANEEELNCIFIDIYGLQDELTPEVEDKEVTVRKADLQRDIKSLISYAVGCMFGRYSLDVQGLVHAGGEWDEGKYKQFPADRDNIIPICDDEYFDDDIVGRFVRFIEVVYGKETLDSNLKFIADALGGKGQPKDVIRDYFMNGFYADHLKIYQKRPIYWLFDSGKKNGFKALIYMHRYQPDTIARIRTDYVHEQQGRYRTAIADLENQIESASTSERVKLTRKLTALQAQADEILSYEEKIHHLADQMISIDLDDGVKKNYEIFSDVLAKIK